MISRNGWCDDIGIGLIRETRWVSDGADSTGKSSETEWTYHDQTEQSGSEGDLPLVELAVNPVRTMASKAVGALEATPASKAEPYAVVWSAPYVWQHDGLTVSDSDDLAVARDSTEISRFERLGDRDSLGLFVRDLNDVDPVWMRRVSDTQSVVRKGG